MPFTLLSLQPQATEQTLFSGKAELSQASGYARATGKTKFEPLSYQINRYSNDVPGGNEQRNTIFHLPQQPMIVCSEGLKKGLSIVLIYERCIIFHAPSLI
jgi:hypothetical protein